MNDKTTRYRLSGWLRPILGDCLGIPLFANGTNVEFLPETDNRLCITAFHAFFNDEGYIIDRNLPAGASELIYEINIGVPIPFSNGTLTIIAASGEGLKNFLDGQDQRLNDPIVKAVADILEQSESGTFERHNLVRRQNDLKARHAVIFQDDPVHSRYWVEQLKRTATELDAISLEGEREFFKKELQLAASRWIERFKTSGDPTLLFFCMQEVEKRHLFELTFIKRIYYEVAMHLISSQNIMTYLSRSWHGRYSGFILKGYTFMSLTMCREDLTSSSA